MCAASSPNQLAECQHGFKHPREMIAFCFDKLYEIPGSWWDTYRERDGERKKTYENNNSIMAQLHWKKGTGNLFGIYVLRCDLTDMCNQVVREPMFYR